MRPIEEDEPERRGVGPVVLYDARANAQSEAPPFCSKHATSAQRKKLPEAQMRECSECKLAMSTNYETFAVCPPCARKVKRCVVCGDSTEPTTNNKRSLGAPPMPPMPWDTQSSVVKGKAKTAEPEEEEEDEEEEEEEEEDEDEDEEEGYEDEDEEEEDYDDEDEEEE